MKNTMVEIDEIHQLIKRRVLRIKELKEKDPLYKEYFDLFMQEIISFGIELGKKYPSKLWPKGKLKSKDTGYFEAIAKKKGKS